ncbi:hypothetical protein BO71DRAFT_405399 [Aspergillus ellipticus CBS 707.79]|uniref:Uncharacterized protein n=1 Tax=Aspergillus ellipticus CBS 707.79 TaxID=1448320 RepID=A0A319E776_9EURO|nr:hypothetical protein BO71DRAFT_405399 [Aspergillus ellipticus CBS 707.79]
MEGPSEPTGNAKRAFWRSKCRERLSQHIYDTLGLAIKALDIRLKPIESGRPYSWQIDNPKLLPLFEKHLSKHSVGAYIQLCKSLKHDFRAVRMEIIQDNDASVTPQKRIEELVIELKETQNRLHAYEESNAALEINAKSQETALNDANLTIYLQQQELEYWMGISEMHRVKRLQDP